MTFLLRSLIGFGINSCEMETVIVCLLLGWLCVRVEEVGAKRWWEIFIFTVKLTVRMHSIDDLQFTDKFQWVGSFIHSLIDRAIVSWRSCEFASIHRVARREEKKVNTKIFAKMVRQSKATVGVDLVSGQKCLVCASCLAFVKFISAAHVADTINGIKS